MPSILGANSVSGYDISNAVRLNDGDSMALTNDPGGGSGDDGSRTIFSISMWIKRSELGLGNNSNQNCFISASATNNFYNSIKFNGDDKIQINLINSGSDQDEIVTNAQYRDTNAWYHLFFAFDKTQAAIANGVKLYVNGVLQSFGTTTYAQNQGYHFSRPGKTTAIGRNQVDSSSYFDGYIAEVHFIDGTAKAHTDFGETDDNGIWIPKEYDGTYGTYGFFLEFQQTGTGEDANGIGADTSGNNEHFARTGILATDIVEDTPTNNFLTWNSLYTNSRGVFAAGNLQVTTNVQGSEPYGQVEFGNFHVNSGKWYWEVEVVQVGSGGSFGLGMSEKAFTGIYVNGHNNGGSSGNVRYAHNNGNIGMGSATAGTGATYTDGDTIMFAMDLDNSKFSTGKNGTWYNSQDPSDNTNAFTLSSQSNYGDYWTPWISKDDTTNNAKVYLNTGNPVLINDSDNSDSAGIGRFEYAVPSGYFALCTKNLATYG